MFQPDISVICCACINQKKPQVSDYSLHQNSLGSPIFTVEKQ